MASEQGTLVVCFREGCGPHAVKGCHSATLGGGVRGAAGGEALVAVVALYRRMPWGTYTTGPAIPSAINSIEQAAGRGCKLTP